MKQRIIQFCHRIIFADAISNHLLELWRVFADSGYDSIISAYHIGKNLREKDFVIPIEKLKVNFDDILIYHNCGIYDYAFILGKFSCKKIFLFHNETPEIFLNDYKKSIISSSDKSIAKIHPHFLQKTIINGIKARHNVKKMASIFPISWTVSHYNASCLRKAGFNTIEVLPIPFKRSKNKIKPTFSIIKKYSDTKNIIFVGRIVSNKKQMDIIKAFAYYNKLMPDSCLFLIGEFAFSQSYKEEFLQYAKSLGLINCVFMPGKISYEDLEAYWCSASLFLSMSEHEGFCVPILEAFAHEIPVLAYASSAVTETVGNAGLLFYEKNFPRIAETMHSIIENHEYAEKLKTAGLEQIKKYDPDILSKTAVELLEKCIKEYP